MLDRLVELEAFYVETLDDRQPIETNAAEARKIHQALGGSISQLLS